MHRAALDALGLRDWSYQRLPCPPELLEETVRALGGLRFHGANVTIPHKEAALALADSASSAARAIGAANTLTFAADGAIHATNTDAPGFLAALGLDIRGRTATVLGAGGSARAVVHALVTGGAAVGVWNRTPQRAAALATALGARAIERAETADVLVNTTAVGLGAHDDPFKALPLDADAVGEFAHVVDLVYAPGGTALIAAARAAGSRGVDGLEVLVEQGALSLEAWTGREVPRDALREGARGEQQHPPQLNAPTD